MSVKYMYAALLLHSAAQPITEENVKKVFQALGTQVDEVRVKALVAALSEVKIDDVLKSAMALAAQPAAAPAAPAKAPAEEKEEKPEVEEKKKEEALEGLGALFG